MDLGVLFIVAVGSLATYGILIAGWLHLLHYSFPNKTYCDLPKLRTELELAIYSGRLRTVPQNNNYIGTPALIREALPGNFLPAIRLCCIRNKGGVISKVPKRYIHSTEYLYNTNKPDVDVLKSDIKSLHSSYIRELYKDRNAPVIPFHKESLLATCTKFSDKKMRVKFLKEWGSNSGIYIIEYKYDPLVYYLGRTSLFKRRFNNHFLAESGNKLHTLLKLIGWEYFNVSIVETCSKDKLGNRENFYLQKYLPLLNSVFSSSITEDAINTTLKSKLKELRRSNSEYSSLEISNSSGRKVPVYIYDISEKGINPFPTYFNTIRAASLALEINPTSLSQYRDTSIPYRGKLVYTNPIKDLDEVFEVSKKNTPEDLLNKVIPVKVWVYEAKTLELVKGSPFFSKRKASMGLGISRRVIDYFLDKGKAEGVKGNYLYSRPLDDKEIKSLIKVSKNLELGNKRKVWAYNAKTLELINNSPFPSIQLAANYFNVEYRTISRHLDTKLATLKKKIYVYFFKKEMDLKLKEELTKDKPTTAGYIRTEIWVYRVGVNGKLTLIPDQPFKTKREALRILGLRLNKLNENLDTHKAYKSFMFFTSQQ
jgi:hypothetical protein